jgi:hypothetical protein
MHEFAYGGYVLRENSVHDDRGGGDDEVQMSATNRSHVVSRNLMYTWVRVPQAPMPAARQLRRLHWHGPRKDVRYPRGTEDPHPKQVCPVMVVVPGQMKDKVANSSNPSARITYMRLKNLEGPR